MSIRQFVSENSAYKDAERQNSLVAILSGLADPSIKYKKLANGSISSIAGAFSATLSIITDSEGQITRLSLTPSDMQYFSHPNQLHDLTRKCGISLSLYMSTGSTVVSIGNPSPLIASLSKLFVASPILSASKTDPELLAKLIFITPEDIDKRSWGNNVYKFEQSTTVKTLISRTLLGSDNTACNTLLRYIHYLYSKDLIPAGEWLSLLNTKQEYSGSVPSERTIKDGTVRHHRLTAVADSLRELAGSPWTPYDELPNPLNTFIFKGGNQPGAIAGGWIKTHDTESPVLVVAANANRDLNLVEETCILQYSRALFQKQSNIDLTLPGSLL